jgi:hypothetical protein
MSFKIEYKFHDGDFPKRVILLEKNDKRLQSAVNTWKNIETIIHNQQNTLVEEIYEWNIVKSNKNDYKN